MHEPRGPLIPSPAHGPSEATPHATVRSYVTGFVLSVVLTAIPFVLVMSGLAPAATTVPICVALGVAQIVVHLVYFLHMNTSSSQTWNTAAFVFTFVIVAILVGGSLWVMYHMDMNMMPGMMPME
ncbi:MAG TPA: cytochrome o ubiquinol oxidase subunit IV [Methylovirgula sp.]|nr:cytochrome o ubiquinol oxidase subunit IV [Methylovirgula sp.]